MEPRVNPGAYRWTVEGTDPISLVPLIGVGVLGCLGIWGVKRTPSTDGGEMSAVWSTLGEEIGGVESEEGMCDPKKRHVSARTRPVDRLGRGVVLSASVVTPRAETD